jgi:ABC-type nitrate/sulfonate/bicarbonate transport system substrate-binding protein
MSRRACRATLVVLALTLLAAPAFAAGPRAERSVNPLDVTTAFTRLWAALVQHLPFAHATAPAAAASVGEPADQSESERGADLDPWG